MISLMDISDIIFSNSAPLHLKKAILEIMDQNGITDAYMKVLIPTESNDDVNGSQHARNGGNDFTYTDPSEGDLNDVHGLGYYEYFSVEGDLYTGHYYNGSYDKFAAIVLDPPEYAVSVTV